MDTEITFTSHLHVSSEHLACHVGSGDLPVLATPIMASLMENAAMKAVEAQLEKDMTTVGGMLSISHLAPTLEGKDVSATAVLVKEEGRKLEFKVTAHEGELLIGEGTHIRYIVERERFRKKAGAQ